MNFATGLLTTIVVLVVLAGLFLLSGWILMMLVNVVLGYYDAKQLDFATSLAVTGILWIFGGALNFSKKD